MLYIISTDTKEEMEVLENAKQFGLEGQTGLDTEEEFKLHPKEQR